MKAEKRERIRDLCDQRTRNAGTFPATANPREDNPFCLPKQSDIYECIKRIAI